MPGILKISAAAKLAIHALTHMVQAEDRQPVTAASMAVSLGVSVDHLGKVLQLLARAMMLSSRRGPGGGFSLTEATKKRTLLEVVELFDGKPTASPCLLAIRGCKGEGCFLSRLEHDAAAMLVKGLTEMRVMDLVHEDGQVTKVCQESGHAH